MMQGSFLFTRTLTHRVPGGAATAWPGRSRALQVARIGAAERVPPDARGAARAGARQAAVARAVPAAAEQGVLCACHTAGSVHTSPGRGCTTAPLEMSESAAPLRQALGYGIITAACVVKVPQISAIARAGSARGLSALSFELEQLGLSVNAANGFVLGLPFSAYGEALVLVLQNTVLLAQIYALSRAPLWRALLVAVLFFGGGISVLTGTSLARERAASPPRA